MATRPGTCPATVRMYLGLKSPLRHRRKSRSESCNSRSFSLAGLQVMLWTQSWAQTELDTEGAGGRWPRTWASGGARGSTVSICRRGRMGGGARRGSGASAPRASVRGGPAMSSYVFVDELSRPYHPVRLTRTSRATTSSGPAGNYPSRSQAHFATVALLAGVHPKVVAERHGHASTQITLVRYSHVIESIQLSAAEAIGRFLQQAE
jgi:hypothetical protein